MLQLHDFMWIGFILESKCINAEKIFELSASLVKFSDTPEERAANMLHYLSWKDDMHTFHGCMQANLMKIEAWENEVEARPKGVKQMKIVKALYKEFTAYFDTMKGELMNPGRRSFIVFVCFCIGEGGRPPLYNSYNCITLYICNNVIYIYIYIYIYI